jgi:hypothetical protein
MSDHVSGRFDIKLSPLASDKVGGVALARMSIDKQFHGDLAAISKGEMLSAVTDTKGSAGYVAIERVSGTLRGLTGSFVLQHTGIMTRGTPHLTITVVPDSGTEQLAGLSGSMSVNVVDGRHYYEFDFNVSDAT